MSKVMVIESKGGLNTFIKITSILNRRRFLVDKISMVNMSEASFQLEVTLNSEEENFNQALRYIKKIEDVYDINEKKEEKDYGEDVL